MPSQTSLHLSSSLDAGLEGSVGVGRESRVGVLSDEPQFVLQGFSQFMEVVYFGTHFVVAIGPERVVISMPSTQPHLLKLYFLGLQKPGEELFDIFEDLMISPRSDLLTGFPSHKDEQNMFSLLIGVDETYRVGVVLLFCHKVDPALLGLPKRPSKKAEQLFLIAIANTRYCALN